MTAPFAEMIFGGVHRGEYPGAFPPRVEKIIRRLVGADGPVLHLFSGSSVIGDVRVDINPDSNATHKIDVFDFLKSGEAERPWKWVIGDPDYTHLQAARLGRKNKFSSEEFTGTVGRSKIIDSFMEKWAENIIWFDQCMPRFARIFERRKIWLIDSHYWFKVRVLQWLARVEHPLEAFA